VDYRGDKLTDISYNHQYHVQAQADHKRYKISLGTILQMCKYFTFTSDYSCRDDNYLHNPVIEEKSPNGRLCGETIERDELLYQGKSFF